MDIKDVKRITNEWLEGLKSCGTDEENEYFHFIDSLLTKTENMDFWIKMKDQKPKDGQKVLIYMWGSWTGGRYVRTYYNETKNTFDDGDSHYIGAYINDWMPLGESAEEHRHMHLNE